MSLYLDTVFDNLFDAAVEAHVHQDKWRVIDCACLHVERLMIFDYDEVLARILALIEQFPDLDYGGPGPFGTLIEQQPVKAYEAALLASLVRQPSTQVLGWLDRTLGLDEAEREAQQLISRARYADVLRQVIAHPRAPQGCVAFAQMCLEDAG